ncbi:MAG: hypothetical protein KBT27_11410 [Prevotellaceae bacterium]|nr:hypothetical protein [Candidatus Faecinaster equi]
MKITSNVISQLQIGEPRAFGPFDFNELRTARQMCYNRQKQYPGCCIDTSRSFKSGMDNGLYTLVVERLSWGISPKGVNERDIITT